MFDTSMITGKDLLTHGSMQKTRGVTSYSRLKKVQDNERTIEFRNYPCIGGRWRADRVYRCIGVDHGDCRDHKGNN